MAIGRRAVLGCALAAAAAPSRLFAAPALFRAADDQGPDSPGVRALLGFAAEVRDGTGGRLGFEVFHSGLLGEERDTIEQTRAGAIDLDRVNVALLAGYAPLANVLAMPYLFRSIDHLDAVLDGPIGAEILGSCREHGLVGLAFLGSGMRTLYNCRRPVRTPVDLAGLRIRVPQSELMVEIVEAMGATAVPMAFGQTLPAIQTGIVDGAEGDWLAYLASGQARGARFLSETGHVLAPDVLVMSRTTWDSLQPDDQALFRVAAARMAARARTERRQLEAESRRRALETGTVVAPDIDRAAFEAATADTRDNFLSDPAERALHARIRDAVP